VKSYVRNTINLSWDKILLTSVISGEELSGGANSYRRVKSSDVLGKENIFGII
jgi:hypothetical protein